MFSFITQICFIYYLVDVIPFFLIALLNFRNKKVLYKKLTIKCTISNYECKEVYIIHVWNRAKDGEVKEFTETSWKLLLT